jgi:hypothetical protein
MPINSAMIAMTTKSSISVNPRRDDLFFMVCLQFFSARHRAAQSCEEFLTSVPRDF